MIKWILLAVASTAVSLSVYLYMHLGLAKPVDITTEDAGPFVFLFKEHMGAYHEIGKVITEVERWAIAQNQPCSKTFGEYLDDPSLVDQDRLRSLGGCIVPVKPEVPLPEGFSVKEMPRQQFVVARFSGSPAVGPFKVYPKVHSFFAEKRIKAPTSNLEIYTVNGQQVNTEYLFVLPQ